MKFGWVKCGPDNRPRPLLKVGLRRQGKRLPTDTLILVDTGADSTMLAIQFAGLLGLAPGDLKEEKGAGLGGQARVWRPLNPPQTDIEIGGVWYSLPILLFAENTPPLLGRDLIFKHFKLRMEDGETDLRPLA